MNSTNSTIISNQMLSNPSSIFDLSWNLITIIIMKSNRLLKAICLCVYGTSLTIKCNEDHALITRGNSLLLKWSNYVGISRPISTRHVFTLFCLVLFHLFDFSLVFIISDASSCMQASGCRSNVNVLSARVDLLQSKTIQLIIPKNFPTPTSKCWDKRK